MKNALVFSQSEARNYFMYTRNDIITVCAVKSQVSVSNLTNPTLIETYTYGKTVTHKHFPVYRPTESVFQA